MRTTIRGYGWPHQRERKRWASHVERGEVDCTYCGRLILPGSPWDLSHPGDNKAYPPVPWHASCNRSYAAVKRARLYGQVLRRKSLAVTGERRTSRQW
jgi:hypothetical protein